MHHFPRGVAREDTRPLVLMWLRRTGYRPRGSASGWVSGSRAQTLLIPGWHRGPEALGLSSATEQPVFASECSAPWQGWGGVHEDQSCSQEHGAPRGPTTKAQEGHIHLQSCQPGEMVIKDQARHPAQDSDTAPGIVGEV